MKENKVYVKHIADEVEFILKKTKSLSFNNFMDDETLKRAVSRSLEIIGEAAKNIPNDFRSQYPDIKWKEMAGLRDKLIHSYFGIDWYTVWDIVTKEIPELKIKLDRILK